MASQSIRWWALEGKQALDGVWSTVRELEQSGESRLDAYARYLEAYDVELPTNGRRGNPYRRIDEEVLTPNKFRRVLDTIQAKIIRNKILPQAVSTGGDYSTRAKAKGFSLFLEGLLATENMDAHADLAVRDALLCGFAALKVTPDAERVCFDRLKPWCLHLREAECNGGMPRRLYYVDDFDRGALADMFPESESAIMAAPMPAQVGTTRLTSSYNPDAVRVCEAWSLGTEDKPGRHIIAIEGHELLSEEWTEPEFPVAILRFYAPPIGFFPVPLAKLLLPIQRELEFTAAKLQRTFRIMSSAHFIVAPGVEFSTEQMTNEPGTIWRANPGQIQPFSPPAVAPDLYRYFTDLGPMMTEMSGASAMSVANQKPGGVTSGIALQTLDDVEAEGFLAMHRAFSSWHVQIAKLAIRACAAVAEESPKFAVRVMGKGRAQTIRWRDVAMDDDEYEIRVMPTSQFARDFAARIDQGEKLLQLGALTVPQFREVLDLPDLQAENDLDLSDLQIIDRNIEAILVRQFPIIAEPFDNLAMILQRGVKAYNLARLNDADPVALELLRRYIQSAQDLQAAAAAPPPPAPGAAPGPEGLPPELAQLAGQAPALA
jgi:hypothetical protein